VLLLLCFSVFGGCYEWQKDVTIDGVHFGKVRHTESGNIIGFLDSNVVIDGFRCAKGWVHLYEDRSLLRFTLYDAATIQGNTLPEKSWVTLDPKGRLMRCAYPEDIQVQGYVCKGTGGPGGVMTGFYESGKLQSFFSPKNIEVQGVLCKGGGLNPIFLHESGQLKTCTVAKSKMIQGRTVEKGQKVVFDIQGKIISVK
ncbi:MAG: hypothetical protein QGG48_11265, partial [Desulfatiglandales bacterium]|nr:hypothetical protein [Desulfatiglandales bacterium]